MPNIHLISVIESGAQIAEDVTIGPFCHVGAKAVLGAGTRLVSHVAILGRTTLGERNTVWPHATLGADPQDLKFQGEDSELILGDHNQIHENVTIQKGTANGGGVTRLGSRNLLMVGAHVAHDCLLGDGVVLANNVLLAGHVAVDDGAVLSGAAALHHFVRIGRFAFVGGMTRVVHDVPPFMIFEGLPAKVRAVNVVGLERAGFSKQDIQHLKDAHRLLYRGPRKSQGVPRSMADRLGLLPEILAEDANVAELATFVTAMAQGLYGRQREPKRRDPRRPQAIGPQAR